MRRHYRSFALVIFAFCGAAAILNHIRADPAGLTVLTNGLALPAVGKAGRNPLHTDALELQMIRGEWRTPAAGDRVELPDGKFESWREIRAQTNGWFADPLLRGGYVDFRLNCQRDAIKILHPLGDSIAYVNGEPHTGDPYRNGTALFPFELRAGANDLLFHAARGQLRVELWDPPAPVFLDLRDNTLPDLVAGRPCLAWGAVLVVNASGAFRRELTLEASAPGLTSSGATLPVIAPFSVRKVPFQLPAGVAPRSGAERKITLTLRGGATAALLDTQTVAVRIRQPNQSYKQTFLSRIDGTTQYYAVLPARPLAPSDRPQALFLSLHGASVEAIGQADAYSPKSWGTLVAPTNRRPYGFDWEDWGRRDALEVLDLALAQFHPDPHEIYLTGHSMGGHGTWIFGATYPDRFAAIGPSAGWISFWSYAGSKRESHPTPVEELLQRAANSSNTLLLSSNYLHFGIYVLHGSADDNVPVTEARRMVEQLRRFHHDFVYHEQPGVGHWWDISNEPGADCVDWAPMFDFFARRRIPDDDSVREIRLTTVNPAVSSSSHWLTILQQDHCLDKSAAEIEFDPGRRRFVGATANVRALAFDVSALGAGEPVQATLDGQRLDHLLPRPPSEKIFLRRDSGRWMQAGPPPDSEKNPRRSGPFKEAFARRMIFVYGTSGTAEENRWAFSKARFDAETFLYRGNGAADLVPDSEFDPARYPERNVILYGNARSNRAWPKLLADSPAQVVPGEIRVGGKTIRGDDLACLFVRPRPGTKANLVGVVSGSGLAGMQLTVRLPYFMSGVEYPDCIVLSSEMLRDPRAGLRAAGFFGNDWRVETGEFRTN